SSVVRHLSRLATTEDTHASEQREHQYTAGHQHGAEGRRGVEHHITGLCHGRSDLAGVRRHLVGRALDCTVAVRRAVGDTVVGTAGVAVVGSIGVTVVVVVAPTVVGGSARNVDLLN